MDSIGGVGVLDKGVRILRAVAERPLDLVALQAATGLPRATCHRLAVALEHHHLLRRDALGRFCLGFELIRLGRVAADEFPLAEVATPVLEQLRERTGESVQLYVREGDARRCVVSLDSPHGLRWIVPEGVLFPLPVGSAGRLLAGEPAGAEGWLATVEEREPGVASVSAPVHDRAATLVAAVCVSGPIERVSREPGARFGDAVVRASTAITAAIPN
jgi:DNA-binding IclR family transcriptional regulator